MWHSRWTLEFQPLSANPPKCKSLSPRTIIWISRRLWNSRLQKKSSLKKYARACHSAKQIMEYQWPGHPKLCKQVKRATDRPKIRRASKLSITAETKTSYSTLHKSANVVNLLTITPKVNPTCQLCSTNQLKSISAWPPFLCRRAQLARWWAAQLSKRPRKQTTLLRMSLVGVRWLKVHSTLDIKTTNNALTLRFQLRRFRPRTKR